MSVPRIILASLPSFCKKNHQKWSKFDKVQTKTNFHSFSRHGVVKDRILHQCSYPSQWSSARSGKDSAVGVEVDPDVDAVSPRRSATRPLRS